MALDKQIHLYSVDTNDFYKDCEISLEKRMRRYRKYKSILKSKKEHFNSLKDYDYKEKYFNLTKRINTELKQDKEKFKKMLSENEDIRILREDSINDKKVVSVFESTLTRTLKEPIGELTEDIIIVKTYFYEVVEQIVINGFYYKGEKYKYFSSSAGQIRQNKTVFIKEQLWEDNQKSLMCGLTIDSINEQGGMNVNKFLAYLCLSNSATENWENFNIDKCIVVNDFETEVLGDVDIIDDVDYSITRDKRHIPITHTDGCGMILPSLSKKNFMIRLPWVKGLLAVFDFKKFIKENNASPKVKDIYGVEWDILKDDIQIILTESQFKMHKYYKDWQEYKDCYKKYNCMAGVCNVEDDYFSHATINYQMIQTLTDMTSEEVDKILKSSQTTLYNISRDKKTMLRVFGVTKSNSNKTNLQKALEIYPELLQDEYCKSTLRQIKSSLIKDYKSAKIDVEGKYTFLIPDLYAFSEFLFLGIENPKGILIDGEVCCRLFKDGVKLDCLRSPHLYNEHAIRKNNLSEEKVKWFTTNAIYTSTYDLISKILQFDNDGDKSLVVSSETIINVAERNIKNYDIVSLYYHMKKAKPEILNGVNIFKGLNSAFSGGNIGMYSNNISKIWNGVDWIGETEEKKKEAIDTIKLLCMENNFIIDYAKCLYKPTRPEDKKDIINQYTKNKLPHFFKYAKDKEDSQIENVGCCVVDSFDKKIKNEKMIFNVSNFGKLNYRNLMKNKYIELDYDNVIDKFVALNKKYHFKLNQKNAENVDYIKDEIFKELLDCEYDENDICDMIVRYLFGVKKNYKHKKLLWVCFGDIIVENLKNNIPSNSIQCDKCGERFIPNSANQKRCEECSKDIKYYKPIQQKTIKCIDCGLELVVDSWDMKTCRCGQCKKEHDKEYQRELMRKRREKQKMLG